MYPADILAGVGGEYIDVTAHPTSTVRYWSPMVTGVPGGGGDVIIYIDGVRLQ